MLKTVLSLSLATLLAMGFASPSYGAFVFSDSGGSSIDVHGTATGGTATTAAYPGDALTSINGTAVDIPLSSTNITFTSAFVGTGTKTFGSGANQAILQFSILSGASVGLHLLLDGVITAITKNSLPGWDFSTMLGAENVIDINNARVNFANVVGHAGVNANGSGFGLSETQVVPEPGSLTLLGLGLASFGAVYWKKRRKPEGEAV